MCVIRIISAIIPVDKFIRCHPATWNISHGFAFMTQTLPAKKPTLILMIALLSIAVESTAQKTLIYQDPHSQVKEGIALYKQGQFINARRLFEAYLNGSPPLTSHESMTLKSIASFYTALCAIELNQPDAELLMLQYLKDFHETPERKLAYYHLGRYYFKNRNYGSALKYLEMTGTDELSPAQLTEYKFQMGYAYFLRKKFTEAKSYFKDIINVKGKYYYPANYYYGYIVFDEGDYDAALKSFQICDESPVYKKLVPYYLVQIYYYKKDYEKLLEYAIPLVSDQSIDYYYEINQLIGQTYFQLGDYEKAISYFNIFLDGKGKGRKEDLYQLAFAYFKTGDCRSAVPYFKQLNIARDSLGQNAMYLLAQCYLKDGDKNNARTALFQASQLDSDPFIRQHSLFNYAKLSLEMGYTREAIDALEEYLRDYPGSDDEEEAKELLTRAFLETNDYKRALEVIESMGSMTPQTRKAYQVVTYNLGVESYNDQRYDDAVRYFDLSLKNPLDAEIEAWSHFWKAEIAFYRQEYDNAIREYNQYIQLKGAASSPTSATVNAFYGIGYCYFKKESYGNAYRYFTKVVAYLNNNRKTPNQQKVWHDATLRTADCAFILRKYDEALERYNAIIASKSRESDYALYQKGVILGLKGNLNEKISQLRKLIQQFPKSTYADDALFDIADAYLLAGNNREALSAYNQLVKDYPTSPYTRKAHLQIALIYYNQNDYDRALAKYNYIIENFSGSQEARDALLGIKNVSIAKGDPDIYIRALEKLPGNQLKPSTQDSITYLAAETHFFEKNCAMAVDGFNKYLKQFPEGYFSLNAHYYRAECLRQLGKKEDALVDYQYVVEQPVNAFTENAVLQTAEILYHVKKDIAAAARYYEQLENIASTPVNRHIADLGIMRTALLLEDYPKAITYAQLVMNKENATPVEITEAKYTAGKAAFNLNKYDEAISTLNEIAGGELNRFAAEAKYLLALAWFKKGDLDKAKELCLANARDLPSSYEYWRVKSFVLLADIFIARKDYFQARATLESIIQNYTPEDDVKMLARQRLQELETLENQSNQIIDEPDTVLTVPDTSGTNKNNDE